MSGDDPDGQTDEWRQRLCNENDYLLQTLLLTSHSR